MWVCAMMVKVFRADTPPDLRRHNDFMEAAYIKGNMGGFILIKLQAGEQAAHVHEQEHVGVVLEGEFSFTDGEHETMLRAGDVYHVPPNVRHGVRCTGHALIVQARADFKPVSGGEEKNEDSNFR
jgi:quercetin dioxygenase-like cupin family protein